MGLCGGIEGRRLARYAKLIYAALLLLVISLVCHWGLATGLASVNDASRPSLELERITSVEAENHLALVRSAPQSLAPLRIDQRFSVTTILPDESGGDLVPPHDGEFFIDFHSVARPFSSFGPIVSPKRAFQARGPPAA